MALTPNVRVTQGRVYALGNYPSIATRVTQARVYALAEPSTNVRVTQARVFALCAGRIASPRVLAWTYTLDEHTHYILRLGTQATIEYDVKTGMWAVWGSGSGPVWRAYTGMNWQGAGPLRALGSNVVVGDDGNGAIYILDPDGEADDDALEGVTLPRPFTRKITGQLTLRGRDRQSVPGVELLGSVGQQTSASLTAITLYISDDRGISYTDMGTIEVAPGETDKWVDWRSLGSMQAPGRLFRVEDDGALKRIDSLSMK